jgi:hypothetical protein
MPYGQVLVDTVKDSLNNVLAPASAVFRNRIINGAMVIDQRNTGGSVTPTGNQYILDRWSAYVTQTSKFSVQQNAGSVTPPAGFSNYLGVTSLSAYSIGAGDLFTIGQPIEGFNTADLDFGKITAKTITLSFWVRSSLTGTFGGAITNSAQNRSYPYSYTISSANTWEQKSVTITGDTTGTWIGATNGNGMYVHFGLGAGSTYSGTAGSWSGSNYFSATGATSVVGTSGAIFYITGVQLEVGLNATGFEYRQYGQELALCQRYYYQFIGPASGTNYVGIASGVLLTTTILRTSLIHKVPMRTSPTITPSTAGTISVQAGIVSSSVSGITAYTGNESALIDWTFSPASTAGTGGVVFCTGPTMYTTISAEL